MARTRQTVDQRDEISSEDVLLIGRITSQKTRWGRLRVLGLGAAILVIDGAIVYSGIHGALPFTLLVAFGAFAFAPRLRQMGARSELVEAGFAPALAKKIADAAGVERKHFWDELDEAEMGARVIAAVEPQGLLP